jgi:hypothetical protein
MFIFYTAIWQQYDFIIFMYVGVICLFKKKCDKVCQLFAAGRWFPPGPPVSSANKIDRYDITEILLKVALNTNNSNFQMQVSILMIFTIHVTCDLVLVSHDLYWKIEKINKGHKHEDIRSSQSISICFAPNTDKSHIEKHNYHVYILYCDRYNWNIIESGAKH